MKRNRNKTTLTLKHRREINKRLREIMPEVRRIMKERLHNLQQAQVNYILIRTMEGNPLGGEEFDFITKHPDMVNEKSVKFACKHIFE